MIAAIAVASLRSCRQRRGAGLSGPHRRTRGPVHAGSSADILGRVLADGMSAQLGQRIVVLNKPGAGGILGTAAVAQAKPDGYTLMHGAAVSLTVQPLTERQTGYTAKSFDADLPDLQERPGDRGAAEHLQEPWPTSSRPSKAKPGGLNYGSPGLGTIPHLSMAELSQITKVEFNHVPFKGPAESIQMTIGRPDRFRRGAADRRGEQRARHARPVRAEAQSVDPRRADREGAGLRRRAAEHRRAGRAGGPARRRQAQARRRLYHGHERASRSSASSRARSSQPTTSPTARALPRTSSKDVADKRRLLTALGMVKS